MKVVRQEQPYLEVVQIQVVRQNQGHLQDRVELQDQAVAPVLRLHALRTSARGQLELLHQSRQNRQDRPFPTQQRRV